jgi:hypothetical protein
MNFKICRTLLALVIFMVPAHAVDHVPAQQLLTHPPYPTLDSSAYVLLEGCETSPSRRTSSTVTLCAIETCARRQYVISRLLMRRS